MEIKTAKPPSHFPLGKRIARYHRMAFLRNSSFLKEQVFYLKDQALQPGSLGWGASLRVFWQLTGKLVSLSTSPNWTLWLVTGVWAVVMGCFATAGSLPLLSMWGTTRKAVPETGQWPEHSRKALLLGNMLLLVLQEFIDNKEKDTKYIWIGLKTQDMKKQWSSVEDTGVKQNRWWFVGGGCLWQ